MSIKPEKTYSRKFEAAFIAGERSDHALHKALIEILVDFHKSDFNTVGVFWSMAFMYNRNPESARYHAIKRWYEENGFRFIFKDEKLQSVKTNKNTDFGQEWLRSAKRHPWFKVARDMQKAKAWSDPLENVKRQYATGYLMGDISREQIAELFAPSIVQSIVTMAMTDEKLQKTVTKRMEALEKAA